MLTVLRDLFIRISTHIRIQTHFTMHGVLWHIAHITTTLNKWHPDINDIQRTDEFKKKVHLTYITNLLQKQWHKFHVALLTLKPFTNIENTNIFYHFICSVKIENKSLVLLSELFSMCCFSRIRNKEILIFFFKIKHYKVEMVWIKYEEYNSTQ